MSNQYFEDILKRKRTFKIIGQYGIKFLDDFLLGVLQEDFILIGSLTGSGKSELAYDMAFLNAKKGVKVHLFALEADVDEPYNRRIYKKVARMYFNDVKNESAPLYVNMSYRNFITNKYNLKEYENKAIIEMEEESKNLTVHYRGNEFSIETLLKTVKEIEGNCDLLILDHVDYFDLDLLENEHLQMTQIMKCLRNINQIYRLPIVVISHMRKKINTRQILYGIDDFMGSSNKAKQVKTIIILSRDFESDDYTSNTFGTFITVPKTRMGTTGNLVGRILFDAKTNKYEKEYQLGKIINGGTEIINLEIHKYPEWARSENAM